MTDWTIESDLNDVLDKTSVLWASWKGSSIFLTGGTGFIGCWLLETIRRANDTLDANIRLTVLTRDAEAFARKAPHLYGHERFTFVEADVSTFQTPPGEFSYLIHAATDASADLNENNPLQMFDTVVSGTRRVLDFAFEKKVDRVLYLSSGAVYGQQPWEMLNVRENWTGSPDCTNARNAYAEGKRAAEMLCAIYAKQFGLDIVNARIFALLGPYISLGIHFAAGNFIRNAIDGQPIVVNGNGKPCRSYLYASDLTVWLLHLMARGKPGQAYNVGSDEGISIAALAELVANTLGDGEFKILSAADTGWNPGRYVPDTDLASTELNLYKSVSLKEAIRRTALWNGWVNSNGNDKTI